jgi:G:T/U-mismatch repair DNA glycosylase
MWKREKHPNWYHPVPNMKILVLGSFPPIRGRHYEFYYPNRHNRFWPALAEAVGWNLREFEGAAAVDERKRLMTRFRIGCKIWVT